MMKKLNIQRDLNSRAAISEKHRRTHRIDAAPVEPLNTETHGTSEETPECTAHPQGGEQPRKTSKKVRKTEGNL